MFLMEIHKKKKGITLTLSNPLMEDLEAKVDVLQLSPMDKTDSWRAE